MQREDNRNHHISSQCSSGSQVGLPSLGKNAPKDKDLERLDLFRKKKFCSFGITSVLSGKLPSCPKQIRLSNLARYYLRDIGKLEDTIKKDQLVGGKNP